MGSFKFRSEKELFENDVPPSGSLLLAETGRRRVSGLITLICCRPKIACAHSQLYFICRFTYLANKDREHVLEVVSNINCSFRWFLSGTPKHANFNDISNLAALLGVHLGIDEVLPGVKLNKKYLSSNDNSGLESLSHYLESRSLQWHFRRHAAFAILSGSFCPSKCRRN